MDRVKFSVERVPLLDKYGYSHMVVGHYGGWREVKPVRDLSAVAEAERALRKRFMAGYAELLIIEQQPTCQRFHLFDQTRTHCRPAR